MSRRLPFLNANNILSPHIRRAARKKLRKAKLQTENPSISVTEVQTVVSHQVAHPRQQRCKFFGEEIQMDGSLHLWFGDRKAVLHLAVDNAARIIVGAFFDWQETLLSLSLLLTLKGSTASLSLSHPGSLITAHLPDC